MQRHLKCLDSETNNHPMGDYKYKNIPHFTECWKCCHPLRMCNIILQIVSKLWSSATNSGEFCHRQAGYITSLTICINLNCPQGYARSECHFAHLHNWQVNGKAGIQVYHSCTHLQDWESFICRVKVQCRGMIPPISSWLPLTTFKHRSLGSEINWMRPSYKLPYLRCSRPLLYQPNWCKRSCRWERQRTSAT